MHGTVLERKAATAGPVPVPRASPLLSALFLAVAMLVVLRVSLNAILLDLAINYSTDSGSIVEKLHPTLYGFVLAGLIAVLSFRIVLSAWEVRVVRWMLAFNAGIVAILAMTALSGRGGSTGFLIDTYSGACLSMLLFLFPKPWRQAIAQLLLAFMTLSACVAIVEFVLKVRLQPFTETEAAFRPIGLSGHPLELGLWMAMGPSFVAATAWPRRVKLSAIVILLAGLGVSGARTALITGSVGAFVLALGAVGRERSPRRRLELRIVVVCAALALIPAAIGLIAAAGGLDRFGNGLVDSNARARIDIYAIFGYMTWNEILFGMDPALLKSIMKTYLNLEYVESSVVIFVTLFGVTGTLLFGTLFLGLVRVLLDRARACVLLGTLVFFIVALSSNGLSSKGANPFLLFALIIGLRPAPAARTP